VWLIVELIYFTLVLLYGLIIVYYTWKVKYSESKYLLIALYNVILSLVIAIPLAYTIQLTEENIFIIAAVIILFATISTVVFVCVPHVIALIFQSWKKHSSSPIQTQQMTTSSSNHNSSSSNPGSIPHNTIERLK